MDGNSRGTSKTKSMNLSKRTQLLILGATSVVCSRIMFWFFDDPEGPNLLVVFVMALIIYLLSLSVHSRFASAGAGSRRLLLTLVAQIVITSVFYFFLS